MPQTVHVYPNNDLIEHDTDGSDCPCGPTPEPARDWIDDLVDHQLANRHILDTVTYRCNACKATWKAGPVCCPECGERRRA